MEVKWYLINVSFFIATTFVFAVTRTTCAFFALFLFFNNYTFGFTPYTYKITP